MLVIAKLVEVALVRSVLPVSVLEAMEAEVPTVRVLAVTPPVKEFAPENVLSLERSVEDAAVIVMFAVPSKVMLLIVRPVCKLVAVEALPVSDPTTPPFALSTPPTLSTLETVEEPVTASAVVVAPTAVSPPLNAICVVVALDGKR